MGSTKSEDAVRCYLMNSGTILSQLASSCSRHLWQHKNSTREVLSCAEFHSASNVQLLGVCGAGREVAKVCLTEQIQSSRYRQRKRIYALENGKSGFSHLLSKINPIVLSNLKVIHKKFEDWLPSLLVKINVYIDKSYLNTTSSLSPNSELSLHITSILENFLLLIRELAFELIFLTLLLFIIHGKVL